MNSKEGDIVLCTVKKIEKTSIFLEIENNGEGSMVLSEVAAGRIRNLREYVTPNKKIVCKVLNIENGNVYLSLRRVTAKEREEVLERHKKERNFANMLKTITKNSESIINKIKEKYEITDFIEQAKSSPEILKKFFTQQELSEISNALKEKIEKEKSVKKIFTLSSNSPSGLSDIKEILNEKNAQIKYLGSSKFSITANAKNFKEANKIIDSSLQQIETKAKQKKAYFKIVEK